MSEKRGKTPPVTRVTFSGAKPRPILALRLVQSADLPGAQGEGEFQRVTVKRVGFRSWFKVAGSDRRLAGVLAGGRRLCIFSERT